MADLAFTPSDRDRADLILDDRPYAAALMFNLGYNSRNGYELRTSHLRLSVVGRAAQGQRVQNLHHDTLGLRRFNG